MAPLDLTPSDSLASDPSIPVNRRLRLHKAVHGGFKDAWVEGGLAEDMVAAVGWLLKRNPAMNIYCTGEWVHSEGEAVTLLSSVQRCM